MTTYLTGGWYAGAGGGLRTEVLDGAMDAAGLLHRAGVSPALVSRLALRVRSLVRVGDAAPGFTDDDRRILGERLEPIVGDLPELVSFVADCLDHVSAPADLMAFYIHLVHITRMLQLLALATHGPVPGGNGHAADAPLATDAARRAPSPRPRRAARPARKKTSSRTAKLTKAAARSPATAKKPRAKTRPARKVGAKRRR